LEFTVREGCSGSFAEHPGKVFVAGDKVELPLGRALEQPHIFEETLADTPPDQRKVLEDAGVIRSASKAGKGK
jgi:hypothetical protein